MIRVLIVGGGFGGAETYRRLHRYTHGDTDIQISLINRSNYFLFSPMLHEVATGSVTRQNITEPLRETVSCCANRFIEAMVQKIDFEGKNVETSNGIFSYEYLVIALGAEPHFFGVEGASEHAFRLKWMEDAIRLRNHIIQQFERAARRESLDKEKEQMLHFVIIGGGPTGTELGGQIADLFQDMQKLYPEIPKEIPKVTLVQSGERLIPQLSKISSTKAYQTLKRKGVEIIVGARAVKITTEEVILNDGTVLKTKTPIWTSGIQSVLPSVLSSEYVNEKGLLMVDIYLRLEKHPEVFGVGDAIALPTEAVFAPQTAQAATQEGKIAGENIFRSINQKPLKRFVFKSKGDLVPIGDWYGIAEIGQFHFSGRLAWWLRRTIFIQHLWSWANRLKVTLDWTINIFRPRDTSEL